MPDPNPNESKKEFISRAIPIIIKDAKAKGKKMSPEQASAIAASMFDKKGKGKETSAWSEVKVKEEEGEQIHTFIGMSTVPDRVSETLPDGREIEGEILDIAVLEKAKGMVNNTSVHGGKIGSYRTIGLFHDRVYEGDAKKEEAGFTKPNARIVELKDFPGHYGLEVDVEVNKFYSPTTYPDYTPDKINYKIEKGALGLSMEYNNTAEQEEIVEVNGKLFRYVTDTDDFRGFSFARANAIGNPTAVSVKEINTAINKINKKGESTMSDEDVKVKEKLDKELADAQAKIKELEEEKKNAEEEAEGKEKDEKVKELTAKLEEMGTKVKSLEVDGDKSLAKMKEQFGKVMHVLANDLKKPLANDGTSDVKIKEMKIAVEKKDWISYAENASVKLKEQGEYISKQLKKGFSFEDHQTLQVKCKGRGFEVVATAKTKEMLDAKTKDVIDATDMAESDYYQTNAMFADRYVPGITETFRKSDDLLTILPKIQHIGGNDKYQWRLWKDFVTVTGDNTLAVDPNNTSVERTQRDFEKMETRIVEYRDGVEVTDFTQFHSTAAVGDLMGLEITRAAEAVRESMAADIFKAKVDDTTAWLGFVGLIGVADSTTYSSMYGKTRSATNRLLDSTLTNTYNTTAEAISVPRVRIGYENVLNQGSQLGEIVITMSPLQSRLLFNSQDASIRYGKELTMAAAPPEFGFHRGLIPHIDAIPIIRDYHAVDSSGTFDMFAVVDVGKDGFVLVVSKPLGARGLAKVGTSESAYVNFWGAAVYKRPRNVYVHDDLTTS